MTETTREICEQVRTLYRVYCQIGGYPAVVRNWVNYKEINSCKEIARDLLRQLYDIRIQDTYGSLSDRQATVPIFMLDKMDRVINAAI